METIYELCITLIMAHDDFWHMSCDCLCFLVAYRLPKAGHTLFFWPSILVDWVKLTIDFGHGEKKTWRNKLEFFLANKWDSNGDHGFIWGNSICSEILTICGDHHSWSISQLLRYTKLSDWQLPLPLKVKSAVATPPAPSLGHWRSRDGRGNNQWQSLLPEGRGSGNKPIACCPIIDTNPDPLSQVRWSYDIKLNLLVYGEL